MLMLEDDNETEELKLKVRSLEIELVRD